LEEEGIMDYSLLVGLQSKGSCQGNVSSLFLGVQLFAYRL